MKKTSKRYNNYGKGAFLPEKWAKCIFFQKKFKKSLVIRKKVVPLHSHSEERSYEE